MSYQRRHGQSALVYKQKLVTDNRGNKQFEIDEDNPVSVKAAFIPQRSARAELPGQQHINITRMILRHDIPDVSLWARVEWNGSSWDIVTPPAYHHGTRQTRHWSIDLRERP